MPLCAKCGGTFERDALKCVTVFLPDAIGRIAPNRPSTELRCVACFPVVVVEPAAAKRGAA